MNGLLVGFAGIAATIAFTASSEAAAQQCTGLIQQYRSEIDTASRYAALNQALDDETTTANEAKESNALSRARMALEAVRGAGCKTAALAPSAKPYMPSANRCKIDTIMSRYGQGLPLTCNPSKWQKN